jgi:hypothetical protein
MLRIVTLVRTDVSKESTSSIIRLTRIGELRKLAVTSNRSTLRRNIMSIALLRSVLRLLVTANFVTSSPILVTLMTEAMLSSETSVLTRVTLRNMPEGGILHSHRCENLKSYKVGRYIYIYVYIYM